MKRISMWLGLMLALIASTGRTADRYVATNGTGDGSSWLLATNSIQGAIGAASSGNTVWLTNNTTYVLTSELSVTKSITVRSWAPDGGLDPATTIIDGNYPNTLNRCFNINNTGAWVKGFTITNGYYYSSQYAAGGGGVIIGNGHLTNCIITCNRFYGTNDGAVSGGGGLYLGSSATTGTVWNCTFSRNTSYTSGGGIKTAYGRRTFSNCTITDNVCSNSGGGVNAWYNPEGFEMTDCLIASNVSQSGGLGGGVSGSASGSITRCVIAANTSVGGGGGVYLAASLTMLNCSIYNNTNRNYGGGLNMYLGRLQNCLIYNNSARYGGGVYIYNITNLSWIESCSIYTNQSLENVGGGVLLASAAGSKGFLANSIIWANQAGGDGTCSNFSIYSDSKSPILWFTNCCTAQGGTLTNMFFTNCVFSDPHFVDIASTNVRLRADSPCINAGVNREWMNGAVDPDGRPRLDHFSRIVDIGAYEYLSKGTIFSGY